MAKKEIAAIPKQFVNLSLTGGLNKKKDPHQLENGELLTADNVIYTAVDAQVTKRFGFAAVRPLGAPFQGGPFKALGLRDNSEPLILGANTLNKYNPTKNLSTTLPTPTQGRLSVKQLAGSTGQSASPWPPSHASCATDGSSYAMLTWEEPNGTGSFPFYGIQDLATGSWVIKPTPVVIYYPTLVGPDNKTYTYVCSHSPKATYGNGFFYFSYVWCGQAFVSSVISFQAFVVITALPITNLSSGAVNATYTYPIPGTNSSAIYNSPTLLSYDFAVDNAGVPNGTAFIIAAQNGTNSLKTNVVTGFINGRTVTDTTVAPEAQYTSVTNAPVSVRVNKSGRPPFSISFPDATVRLNRNGTVSDAMGAGIGATGRFPADATEYGNSAIAAIQLKGIGTSAAAASLSYTNPSPGTEGVNASGVVQWPSPLNTGYMQILSRLFRKAAEPIFYAWIGAAGPTSDTIYNSAYLVEFDLDANQATTICRTMYLNSAHVTGGDVLFPTDVLQISGTRKFVTYLTAITEKASGLDFKGFGTLSRVEFDFNPTRNVQIVSLPTGGCMIAGAYPLYYDGATVNEAGFSSSPDGNPMSQTASSTTAPRFSVQNIVIGFSNYQAFLNKTLVGGPSLVTLSNAIEYYYVICLVRRDAYGNVNRSAPSPVITVPIANPGGDNIPNIYNVGTKPTYNYGGIVTFPPLTYNGGGNVMIEYYRSTQNTPGTYYFLGQVPNGSGFVDNTPDGAIAYGINNSITKNRTVYTNNNELANDPPPATHHMVVSESRAYLIPSDNRNLVWYSKQFTPGRSVEWSAALTLSEGLNSGQFTALAIMDTYLIVFKQDQIIFTYGAGPDNGGGGAGFAPFTRVASDVGCIDPGSVCVIPDGVVFKSRRGIELLTRSLQVVYIGGPVEPIVLSMGTIASVVVMPGYTELRFVPSTAGKPVLSYDYSFKRWSTFSNMAAVQAREIVGEYWHISADGTLVNKETPGLYLDNGVPIQMTLETAEIPVGAGGAQGWGRAYRMALLGDFYNDFVLNIQFAYDHSNTYTDAVNFSTATGLINGDKVFQFRTSRMPRQVMQTVRLKIQDNGTTGQSCAISNVALEVGSKNGLAKLADQKTL